MNKDKIKRIIAREGLILLSLAGLAVGSSWLSGFFRVEFTTFSEMPDDAVEYSMNMTLSKYPYFFSDKEQAKKAGEDKFIKGEFWKKYRPELQMLLGVNFDDGVDDREYAHVNAYIEQMEFSKKTHRILAGTLPQFFAIFAYPIYLLCRFIVWAIRTLKK